MPGWGWALLAVAVVVVVALIVWRGMAARRTRSLQERFGPEYQRTADATGDKRRAEAELAARQERREKLDIRPLPAEARHRYAEEWRVVQEQFVDSPSVAIAAADGLVGSVMTDRGYPMDDFEQRAADVSVDHPAVVENYRRARAVAERSERGEASTEDRRQAMQHYRSLFDELLGDDGRDEPTTRESTAAGAGDTDNSRERTTR